MNLNETFICLEGDFECYAPTHFVEQIDKIDENSTIKCFWGFCYTTNATLFNESDQNISISLDYNDSNTDDHNDSYTDDYNDSYSDDHNDSYADDYNDSNTDYHNDSKTDDHQKDNYLGRDTIY